MSGTGVARQLVFDLTRQPCYDADDFLVAASNEAAVATVRSWPDWPDRTLLLTGPAGSGKSHLAAVWAAEAAATILHGGSNVQASIWDGGGARVLVEDCDRSGLAEDRFFHALNLVRETRGWLLMTARTAPSTWGLATRDLVSRLRLAPLATIGSPDPELIKAVLVKLFADRQIAIDEDVVNYAARHCDQSLDAVARFVDAVDEAALVGGRRITRPLAVSTLAALRTSADQGPT